MPYIAYDLDALDAASNVARASGISDDAAIAGNLRLWAYCWKKKTDVVVAGQLAGLYGSNQVATALVDFGFLEDLGGGRTYRVKGAERYLRLQEARSRGGKAAAGNLRRGPKAVDEGPTPVPATPPTPAGTQPENSSGSRPALSSSIEHRASSNKPPPTSSARTDELQEEGEESERCWQGFQALRKRMGRAPELRPPKNFADWVKRVRDKGFEPSEIATGYHAYLRDADFRDGGWATAVFMSDNVWPQRMRLPRLDSRAGL